MQDSHFPGGRPRRISWFSYYQLTPRQSRWMLAGSLGMTLLIAIILGGYWIVGSFSDKVDVELLGHGDVWFQYQVGFDWEKGVQEAPMDWTDPSFHQRQVYVEAHNEALAHSEPGTVTECRISVNGKLIVQHTAHGGAVRCSLDLATLHR